MRGVCNEVGGGGCDFEVPAGPEIANVPCNDTYKPIEGACIPDIVDSDRSSTEGAGVAEGREIAVLGTGGTPGGQNGSPPAKKKGTKTAEFAIEQSERFSKVAGFNDLSLQEKKILSGHLNEPASDYKAIAKRCGISKSEVVKFMHSHLFESIVSEVVKQRKVELRMAAINALESCLKGNNDKLKLDASIRLLEDAGDLRKEAKPKGDNKITVFWKGNTNIANVPSPD